VRRAEASRNSRSCSILLRCSACARVHAGPSGSAIWMHDGTWSAELARSRCELLDPPAASSTENTPIVIATPHINGRFSLPSSGRSSRIVGPLDSRGARGQVQERLLQAGPFHRDLGSPHAPAAERLVDIPAVRMLDEQHPGPSVRSGHRASSPRARD
jgi:hypothetical protein